MSRPTLPQGTRDFAPVTVRKRTHILDTIKNVFELYGFQPLETPALENLETLMGKYGEEGDKLIFRILNNGLGDPKNTEKARTAFENTLNGKNDRNLTERALRYDLTIPFARYVAMNHGQLVFPFKRYQMQPVWRADRPQKGRYREFYQCDADVVGSNSLLNEVEFIHIYDEVFNKLGLAGYALKINSRKILSALAQVCGGLDRMIPIATAIDKLDKTGIEKVNEELLANGLRQEQVDIIGQYLDIQGNNSDKMQQVNALVGQVEDGRKGIEEINTILERVNSSGKNIPVSVDFSLARGLNYYTGIIFEAKAPAHIHIGSIGGGGRYDDLTGLFDVPGIPGVGISFGVDRIYDVMEEMQVFPADINIAAQVLFLNMGEKESISAFALMQQLRQRGIRAELFHEQQKIDKQFKYAEKKNIPFVVTIGTEEQETYTCKVKDIRNGHAQVLSWEALKDFSF